MGVKGRPAALSLLALGGLLFLCLAVCPVIAGQAASLSIEQAWNHGQEVLVYFRAADLDGAAVSGIEPSQLQARLGGIETPVVRLQQFNHQSEGIAWVVLLDVSRSLDQRQFALVQESVYRLMGQMGPRDSMALMSFGADVRVLCDYTSDQAILGTTLDTMAAVDDNTQMYQGLLQALDLSRRRDSGLPVRRAIVLISDGGEDYYGGASKEEVISNLQIEPVPVYSLGIYNERIGNDAALEYMGEISRASGGRAWQYDAWDLGRGVDALVSELQSSYFLRLDASQCNFDGRDYRLVLGLQQNGIRAEDGISLYLSQASPETVEEDKGSAADWAGIPALDSWDSIKAIPLWILALAGGLVLILICFIIMVNRKKRLKAARNGASPAFSSENGHTRDYDSPAAAQIGPYDLTHRDGVNNPGLSEAGEEDHLVPARVPEMAGRSPVLLAAAGLPRHEPTSGRTAVRNERIGRTAVIVLNMLGKGPGERSFQLRINEARPLLTVGRQPENDLVISDDDRISARHCQFVLDKGRIYVQDLDSTNGTLVNGVPIAGRYALERDDLILIGRTELRYGLKQDDGGPEQ